MLEASPSSGDRAAFRRSIDALTRDSIMSFGRMGRISVRRTVVAVKSVAASPDSWSEDKFLPGDVLEQLKVEDEEPFLSCPFDGGKAGVTRELRKLSALGKKICVRVVRRGRRFDIVACIVSEDNVLRGKQYALADFNDRSYVVSLTDAPEDEIFMMQEQSQKLLIESVQSRLSNVQLSDSLMAYAWQRKMPSPNSSILFSLLVLPFQPGRTADYNDVEDTSARAMTWLSASQKSGVPITFVNIQTELILKEDLGSKVFGVTTDEDAFELANAGSYTVHDGAGADIGVLRAVRLWYAPTGFELSLKLTPDENDRLGVTLSRTEEGFCYVSSVEAGTAADRASLRHLHEAAGAAAKLLVISRLASHKVTPQLVQPSGGIRCFDPMLVSEIVSSHKQARQPVLMSLMLWDGDAAVLQKPSSSSEMSSEMTFPQPNYCSVRYFNALESSTGHDDFSFSH